MNICQFLCEDSDSKMYLNFNIHRTGNSSAKQAVEGSIHILTRFKLYCATVLHRCMFMVQLDVCDIPLMLILFPHTLPTSRAL